ncbi:MAG: ChbG/HpnK family deacetylase [Candidatus Binatia bacterium]
MGLPRRLIVNADGFGFGPGATQGILDALREGKFISSVSVNANFPDVERLRELVTEFPAMTIGVHLNPMVGRPCLPPSQVPSLVGPDGFFHADNFPKLLRKGLISREELKAEFDAQIRKVKQLAGDRLTHLDSQANGHLNYFDLFLSLAHKWGLKRMRNNASIICLEASNPNLSRLKTYLMKPHVWLAHRYRRYQMAKARRAGMRMADDLVTVGYAGTGNKSDLGNWLRVLRNLPSGTHEIYCHPAYPDETLRRWSYYQHDRAMELDLLRGERLPREAKRLGVEIIGFDAV